MPSGKLATNSLTGTKRITVDRNHAKTTPITGLKGLIFSLLSRLPSHILSLVTSHRTCEGRYGMSVMECTLCVKARCVQLSCSAVSH